MNNIQFGGALLSLQDNMQSFALSLTADRDDALDLVQDTTLRVLKHKDKFVDNVNFKGWVLTVMRNIFINNYHKQKRSYALIDQSTDLSTLSVGVEGDYYTPEGTMDLQEIRTAIEGLSELLRIPFEMYVGGYKYHEIAEKLDIPIGTVKSRIFLARKELQPRLKDMRS